MKGITVLGSTGSIGKNTLSVVEARPGDFRVRGLSCHSNVRALAAQIKKFKPAMVSVKDEKTAKALGRLVSLKGIKVYTGIPGMERLAEDPRSDTLVVATSGIAGLLPTLKAASRGKTIALANKETLVLAGPLVMAAVKKSKARILPVDSEHSAIFQCLRKEASKDLKRIYITGSGGPFRGYSLRKMREVTPEQALNHPKWKMGRKISVDSATMMNKGLEVIEACWLFNLPPEKIRILIHPEAVVHSMVEFNDGAVLAQMGVPDMRMPIQYALDYPRRKKSPARELDFTDLRQLTFQEPDSLRFPCLKTAFQVARIGGSSGCVMNAANEAAVYAFLDGKIPFLEIPRIISKVLGKHTVLKNPGLKELLDLDSWARKEADSLCPQH